MTVIKMRQIKPYMMRLLQLFKVQFHLLPKSQTFILLSMVSSKDHSTCHS